MLTDTSTSDNVHHRCHPEAPVGTPVACISHHDDEMLINTHVYGLLAAYTPTMHLRRVDGQFFSTYLESYERVWASACPLDELRAP